MCLISSQIFTNSMRCNNKNKYRSNNKQSFDKNASHKNYIGLFVDQLIPLLLTQILLLALVKI